MNQVMPSDKKAILIEISVGELVDKITILELKVEHFIDPYSLNIVNDELAHLNQVFVENVNSSPKLFELIDQLRSANRKLWQLENRIRHFEKVGDFSDEFIQVARSICQTNDSRSDVKKQINEMMQSRFIEQKNYRI